MKCPACNSSTRVIRTTQADRETIRRHECTFCGLRATSREKFITHPAESTAISGGLLASSIGELLRSLGMDSTESVRRLLAATQSAELTDSHDFEGNRHDGKETSRGS